MFCLNQVLVLIRLNSMLCISPIMKKTPDGAFSFTPVPCGACAACVQRYVNDLSLRAKIEFYKHNTIGYFITLTYSDHYLPKNNLASKSDVQKFFKRLRTHLSRWYNYCQPIKYLLVSEHGTTNTLRVHYHALVFGLPRVLKNIQTNKLNSARQIIKSDWGMGFVDVDAIRSERAITYVLKYISKYRIEHAELQRYFETYLPKSEIILMSKGFGKPTLSQLSIIESRIDGLEEGRVSNLDLNFFTIGSGGFRYALPRYFKTQLSKYRQYVYSVAVKEYVDTIDESNYPINSFELLRKKLLRNSKSIR